MYSYLVNRVMVWWVRSHIYRKVGILSILRHKSSKIFSISIYSKYTFFENCESWSSNILLFPVHFDGSRSSFTFIDKIYVGKECFMMSNDIRSEIFKNCNETNIIQKKSSRLKVGVWVESRRGQTKQWSSEAGRQKCGTLSSFVMMSVCEVFCPWRSLFRCRIPVVVCDLCHFGTAARMPDLQGKWNINFTQLYWHESGLSFSCPRTQARPKQQTC